LLDEELRPFLETLLVEAGGVCGIELFQLQAQVPGIQSQVALHRAHVIEKNERSILSFYG
jgi:hypothetical protein